MTQFKIGPLEFTFQSETWSFSNKPLGYPTLHLFEGSAYPSQSRQMQPGQTLADGKELACTIAAEKLAEWQQQLANLRQEAFSTRRS